VWPDYWAYDSTVSTFAYDPTQAEAILDAAGFRMQPSNNPTQPPARLRFTCLIPDNFAVYERIALEVQRTLYNIGVDMQFSVVSPNEFNSRMVSGTFDAAFVDMISGPTPGRTYMFWHSAKVDKVGYNIFGYEDEAAEQAFETLRTNTSEAATRSATRRLQRIFVDDPPALFLAWNERSRAVRAEFVIPPAEGRDPVWWLWRWTRRAGPPINTTE
jgi:ABC-type transport system substrate-binding protein